MAAAFCSSVNSSLYGLALPSVKTISPTAFVSVGVFQPMYVTGGSGVTGVLGSGVVVGLEQPVNARHAKTAHNASKKSLKDFFIKILLFSVL